jgi:hypothetical protein
MRMDEGVVCVVLTNFERESLREVLKRIKLESGRTFFPIEVLIVDTRADSTDLAHSSFEIEGYENLNMSRIAHPFDGYSSSRRIALDWVIKNRPLFSVLFIDDDDVPAPDCILNFIANHKSYSSAILTGKVIRASEIIKVNSMKYRIPSRSKISGASLMWIPGHLVNQCSVWLPKRLDLSGGEDTSICIRAIENGIPIIKVINSVAYEDRTHSELRNSQKRARLFQESWVFSSVVCHGSYKSKFSLSLFMSRKFLKALIRMPVQPRIGALKIAGFLFGIFCQTPPPRKWEWPEQRRHIKHYCFKFAKDL